MKAHMQKAKVWTKLSCYFDWENFTLAGYNIGGRM